MCIIIYIGTTSFTVVSHITFCHLGLLDFCKALILINSYMCCKASDACFVKRVHHLTTHIDFQAMLIDNGVFVSTLIAIIFVYKCYCNLDVTMVISNELVY